MGFAMNKILGFVFKLIFLAAGLLFTLLLLALTFVLLLIWGLRMMWGRMTGRPVEPLAFTILRRSQFFRPRAERNEANIIDAEVVDVEARSANRVERLN